MIMFHWRNNIYWGRRVDGGVRLVQFVDSEAARYWMRTVNPGADDAFPPYHVLFEFTIPNPEWLSIIASMTKRGESAMYREADAFHNGEAKP